MKLKQARKHYSAEEKVALLRRNLEKGEPVSKLCEEQTLRPTVFYRWKKEFLEGGAAAFDRSSSRQTLQLQQQIREMETVSRRRKCWYHSVAASRSSYWWPSVKSCG